MLIIEKAANVNLQAFAPHVYQDVVITFLQQHLPRSEPD